jgi:hypothetical protein
VQDDTIPLACYLAESLSVAVKLENRPLEKFCKEELAGWKLDPNAKLELGDNYPEYRAVTAYVGIYKIDLEHPRWEKNIDNVVDFMKRDENFWERLLFEPDSIVTVEARLTARTGKQGFFVSDMTMGAVIPDTSYPDRVICQYIEEREYEKVIRAVRGELTAHLAKLLTVVRD